jgi:type IV secretory pathway VirB10-like protein
VKRIGIISTTALFLLIGIIAPANGRQEKQEEKAKPEKQEQQAKPEKQQQAPAPKQQQQHQQQQTQAPKQPQQRDNSAKQQQQAKGQQDQQRQQRQQQASYSQRPQRSQQDQDRQRAYPALRLSGRGSGRIPDERFRSNFGREHRFRINEPVFVDGYSRFQYGGYWFGFVEPWPADWYYTDDVYIDYVDGGYYMYDPYYPGSRFAVTVIL